MKKVIKVAVLLVMILSIVMAFSACSVTAKTEIETFSLDKEMFKVGIISDTQLSANGTEDVSYENLVNTLKVLKNHNVDMIIVGGDIGDLCKKPAYELFNKAMDLAFGDEERPIMQIIMGNHDYWENGIPATCRSRFEKVIGENPWTHYVVNGYHFIGASPATGDMDDGYKYARDWLEKELEKAAKDDPNKPIFVTTHNCAVDTMYGSDDWGDNWLGEVFENYPQVVNFSGHSHYSILDERSIHQDVYTSLTTQSISYTELEYGKENGSVPPNANKTPMGYIMDVYSDKVELHRYNFALDLGEYGKEEKTPWVLPVPLTQDSYIYTFEARKAVNVGPSMTSESGSAIEEEGKVYLSFAAGYDDDFVHSYKMEWSDGTTQLYFSDFYNGLEVMKADPMIEVLNKDKGTYSVKIYAIDSWGEISTNYTQINNVVIK